jgi:hypothetical protein
MTEEDWVGCTSPEAMLNYLGERASPRKLRLYAINCCRRIWHLFRDERCRHAVEVAQRHVDGRATPADLVSAGQVVAAIARIWGDANSPHARATYAIGGAAWSATRASPWVAAWDSAFDARMAAREFVPGADWESERAWQAGMLHDLFRNPFRPFQLNPIWMLAEDGAALHMARVVYEEGRFGDLPYLADALEEAGCTCEAVLNHCRARAPHYRGCWVVDAVLGLS